MNLDFIQKQMTLIGGEQGLQKKINFITIMEAPDFYEWVSGGEFILTTWFAYKQDPTNQEFAFRELAKKVSAIAIKTDRFLKSVPSEFIEIANEYNTPLFAMKRETKFREVIQTIAGEVQNAQVNILREVEQHYQELIQVALATDNLAALLQVTGKRTNTTCFCLSWDRELNSYWLNSDITTNSLYQKVNEFKELHQPLEPNLTEYSLEGFKVFPCTARRQLLGILVFLSQEELSERSHLMIQQAVSILSLKLIEGYETYQKQLKRLLTDITTGEVEVKHLRDLGLSPSKGLYSIAVIKGNHTNINNHLVAGAKQARSIPGDHIIIQNDDELILLGISHSFEKVTPFYLTFLKEWVITKKLPLVLVEAIPVEKIHQLKDALHLARKVAKTSLQMGQYGEQKIKNWLFPSLLFDQLHSLEAQQIHQQILLPILDYDSKHSSELLQTLTLVLQNSKLEDAAKSLFVHVNTIRYRLKKIEELTGYNPYTLNTRLLLGTALILGELRKNLTPS